MSTDEAKSGNRLEALGRALKEAQTMLLEQGARLDAARAQSGEPVAGLGELRDKLAAVTAERDRLQQRLAGLERMQAETVVLPEQGEGATSAGDGLPSIEALMASTADDGASSGPAHRFDGPSAEALDDEWSEMIAPELIVPEAFAAGADGVSRWLVDGTAEPPVRIPLRDGTVTIGRAETADLRLDDQYVSRIHARIVCGSAETIIEDAGSRNGFAINSMPVKRHVLSHGDVIAIGRRRITFVEAARRR